MKAAIMLVCTFMLCLPALSEPLFGGAGETDQNLDTPEGQIWKREVFRRIEDHAPRLNLGNARAKVEFRVDRSGRIYDFKVHRANDAQALIIASIMSSITLPPPPRSAAAGCCWLSMNVTFH
ncbi:hypothetical protein MSC49_21510 [Methylosinus sp. C49]|jgi:hypothetical protein|uniref:TonB C-terminal domain-containing protein n=1 Tax=Methylosinus sp. C49 TaxID=2699395 RepID=UPI001366A900|nr:TonB C-terminal domain-containing protein [Methylosinus sp. C49]BBU62216.1 hypothetical protein MSC49_21510 [Methylosinus sp. C49]